MQIFAYEHTEIQPEGLDLLTQRGHVVLTSDNIEVDTTAVEAIIVRSYTQVNSELLEQYPHLKFVLRVGVGLDNIDLEACKAKNITVLFSKGSNANAVAELSLTLMLTLIRKIEYQRGQMQAGEWRDMSALGSEIHTQTIGLIGCGAVGKKLSAKLAALGVTNILGYDPFMPEAAWAEFPGKSATWDEIWKQSDLISIQVPLTKDTHHSISTKEFELMKPNSYVVNVGRGGVVDEQALLTALNSGSLAGAALDVFEGEPKINTELINHPAIIATPHIAALTHQAQIAMTVQVVQEFLDLQ